MKVSSRGEYGLRALIDLGLHYEQGLIQTSDISRRQNIPEPYLNQLLSALRNAGLVRSKRGPRGGHTLARHPSHITMAEAIIALEGSTAPAPCVDETEESTCALAGECALREFWKRLKQATDAILESTTLEDLCRLQQELQGQVMYYI